MEKIRNLTAVWIIFLFISNVYADEKMYYPVLVTNLPCVLNISLHGAKIDSLGKTNELIKFSIKTTDNRIYYLEGRSENSNLDMKIYSLNKENKIDKLLFPKIDTGSYNYSGAVTNDYSIRSNKPYTNQILCPLVILEEAKYGLVGMVGVLEDWSYAKVSSTNKNTYLYKIERLYSAHFYLPKGNVSAPAAAASPSTTPVAASPTPRG